MASRAASLQISEDDIDDLLYLARTGETQELAKFLGAIASRLQTSEEAIILAAKDDFSGNNALHMTAANGHVGEKPFHI